MSVLLCIIAAMKYLFSGILWLFALTAGAQDTSVVFRFYFIGDAGDNAKPGPALQLLGSQLNGLDSAAVAFLGDNVYPHGFNPKAYNSYPFKDTAAYNRLHAQLMQLKNFRGSAYIIPGNHDWLAQRRNGAQALLREELETKIFIADSCPYIKNPRDERFLPSGQKPGPVAVRPAPGICFIVMDTQYPLQGCIRGGEGQMTAGKRKRVLKTMSRALDSLITDAESKNEKVIVSAHHPMYTNGGRPRYLGVMQVLITYTPLRIMGWAGLDRPLSQGMEHPRYKRMRKAIIPVLEKHGNLLYVSGHDHNTQYIAGAKNNRYIISGSGSKKSRLRKKERVPSRFQENTQTGFVVVEFLKNGKQRLVVYRADGSSQVLDTF